MRLTFLDAAVQTIAGVIGGVGAGTAIKEHGLKIALNGVTTRKCPECTTS
jgi:hypothetical protein